MSDAAGQRGQEMLWREYQMSVDLYKFYLELVTKMLVWYYAITGGILSFYFTDKTLPFARWALLLPTGVSVALVLLFVWGARQWQPVRDNALEVAQQLNLMDFELSALGMLLRGSAVLLGCTAGVTLYLLVAG